jgi:hypothetical protein
VTRLRDALAGAPDAPDAVTSATLTEIATDGTVSVDLGSGRVVASAMVLATYTPSVGDVVQVIRRDTSTWLVLGPTRTSSPATTNVTLSLSFPFNVTPASPGGANPLVVAANNVQSWRNNEGWSGAAESNRAGQGAYSTTWGYYRGCYFYGAGAFTGLAGRTCTGVTLRLHRTGSGGISGAERMWIAPHTHATQPASAPYFPVAAVNIGSLAWNATGTFSLPTSWGQKLIDGVYKGFGHLYLGTADYAICHGLDTDSLSGQVSLSWA